ncbi:MAG: ferredoxin [Nanoarchaeota archaeon]
MAKKFKIIHVKKDCICCGACAAICPDFWEMDEEGLAQLKNSRQNNDCWELEIDTIEAKTCNQEAADVCPVQVIKIESL